MNIKLVFDNTGDELEFRALNCEVVELFIDSLNQNNCNKFHSTNSSISVPEIIQKLDDIVCELALLFDKFYKMPKSSGYGYLNQNILNELHWCFVKFSKLQNLYNLYTDKDVKSKLNDLNDYVHKLESRFTYFGYKTEQLIYINHSFDKTKILSNWPANLIMTYNYLGRSLFTKFINFDINNDFDDENSYDELVGRVNFNLSPVQTLDFSPEYLNWCKALNKDPLGEYLNLGIIEDLPKKLQSYRQIVTQNILDKNTFSIQKG